MYRSCFCSVSYPKVLYFQGRIHVRRIQREDNAPETGVCMRHSSQCGNEKVPQKASALKHRITELCELLDVYLFVYIGPSVHGYLWQRGIIIPRKVMGSVVRFVLKECHIV